MTRSPSRLIVASATFGVMFLAQPTLQLAERFTGTLMPVKCQKDDADTHTTECALKCADSGLGLVNEKGEFVKFDLEGDKKAVTWLKATDRQKDLKVVIMGAMKEGKLQVESIADQK
ncbi:MAG: hypothetical protein U0Q12_20435 [Vicinamibacterales bacterium]